MAKWWFRNRITVGDRLVEPDQDQWVLHQAEGETVTLWRNHDQVRNAYWLRLDGMEYETSDAAFREGRRGRQYVSMAFARAEIAVDMDPVPLPQRQYGDRPINPEVPGLLVMPRPVGVSGRSNTGPRCSLQYGLIRLLPKT